MGKTPRQILRTTPDSNRAPYGVLQFGLAHPDAHKYLWTGRITYVDYEGMRCVVRTDAGGGEFIPDVVIPASAGSGPRSWSGSIPEVGTRVIVGWRMNGFKSDFPVIVSTNTVGLYSAKYFEPSTSIDPSLREEADQIDPTLKNDSSIQWNTIRLKYRKVYPGNFTAQSSQGSELVLDRDVLLTNKSGSEIRLRESDNTITTNVVNEFTSNAAGSYYRGLIRRNAFSFYQDIFGLDKLTSSYRPEATALKDYPNESDPIGRYVYDQPVPSTSPAYSLLLEAGLINQDGTKTFGIDQGWLDYPYVVTSDGLRQNYVNEGQATNGFPFLGTAYVEDRKELRHIADGSLKVIDEIDGATSEFDRSVFIEDVHGTVVGNDFTSAPGRRLYKRILKMRLFANPYQRSPNSGPIFEGINTTIADEVDDAKTIALARLYKIQSPINSNQYVFGVTKQGKVMVHIPSSVDGPPDERGKSLEANILGLVKAVIGQDPTTRLSADIRMQGGLNLDIGKSADGTSINLNLAGPIKRTVFANDITSGQAAEEVNINGNSKMSVVGSHAFYSRGSSSFVSGGVNTVEGNSINLVAGTGGMKTTSSGNVGVVVLGGMDTSVAQKATSSYLAGKAKTIIAGVDSTTVKAGSIQRSVQAGDGIKDSVKVGSITSDVTTGSIKQSVGTGNYEVSVKVGSMSFSNSSGPVTLSSSTNLTVKSPTTLINSTNVTIGKSTGFAVAGAPGTGSIAIDYITGLPLLGIPTIQIG